MSSITVQDLTVRYPGTPPVDALQGVDLAVADGSIAAVLGPSGCGKTTLLRVIAGMERARSGSVSVGSRTLDGPGTRVRPEQRAVGLVPQEGALFPHLDVAANVAFGLQRQARAARRARVAELLALVGLAGFEHRRPHELSGGQQQRVALARALAPRPAVVLLDEPFSALDTALRATLRDEVAVTLRAAGTTAVLVTHDQTEALTMADTVAVMRDGRITQAAPPAEVYRRPADPWTASFLGETVSLPGHRHEDHADTPLGRLPLATGFTHAPPGPAIVVCRPEQIRPATADTGLVATVRWVSFQGPDAVVTLELADHVVTARWPSTDLPAAGDAVPVEVAGAVLTYPLAMPADAAPAAPAAALTSSPSATAASP